MIAGGLALRIFTKNKEEAIKVAKIIEGTGFKYYWINCPNCAKVSLSECIEKDIINMQDLPSPLSSRYINIHQNSDKLATNINENDSSEPYITGEEFIRKYDTDYVNLMKFLYEDDD